MLLLVKRVRDRVLEGVTSSPSGEKTGVLCDETLLLRRLAGKPKKLADDFESKTRAQGDSTLKGIVVCAAVSLDAGCVASFDRLPCSLLRGTISCETNEIIYTKINFLGDSTQALLHELARAELLHRNITY